MLKLPKLEQNWKAYFDAFCAKHGKPLEHRGRLLFPDGWGYSLDNYAGPEYPPPKDMKGKVDKRATDQLRAAYQVLSLRGLKAEVAAIRDFIDATEVEQVDRSVSLRYLIAVPKKRTDPETVLEMNVEGQEELELPELLHRLRMHLEIRTAEIAQAEKTLEQLRGGKDDQRHAQFVG